MYQSFLFKKQHSILCLDHSICVLVDTWVVSAYWLLWMMLLQTCVYTYLRYHCFLYHIECICCFRFTSSMSAGLNFLHILNNAYFLLNYCSSHARVCEPLSHCGIDLPFPKDMTLSIYLLWRNVYSSPLPTFKLGCLFVGELP